MRSSTEEILPVEHNQQLIKRFRYLWMWEFADIFLLPAMGVFFAALAGQRAGVLITYGSITVGLILLQGVVYWRMKLESVQTGTPLRPERLRPFKTWKRINWLVLALFPLVMWMKYLLSDGQIIRMLDFDLFYGLFMYGLAILEQVNYYYYQLMYDYPKDWETLLKTRRLKKSSLRRVLEKFELD